MICSYSWTLKHLLGPVLKERGLKTYKVNRASILVGTGILVDLQNGWQLSIQTDPVISMQALCETALIKDGKFSPLPQEPARRKEEEEEDEPDSTRRFYSVEDFASYLDNVLAAIQTGETK